MRWEKKLYLARFEAAFDCEREAVNAKGKVISYVSSTEVVRNYTCDSIAQSLGWIQWQIVTDKNQAVPDTFGVHVQCVKSLLWRDLVRLKRVRVPILPQETWDYTRGRWRKANSDG